MKKVIDVLYVELKKLKKLATKAELKKLAKAHAIIPDEPDTCIYGIMTGSRYSERATELIKDCCPVLVNP